MNKTRALETLKKTLGAQEGAADDERGVGGDESVSEALSKDIFSNYRTTCTAIDRGIPHPGGCPACLRADSIILLPTWICHL